MTEKLKLLEPLTIGDLHLANRIFMTPLTRCRASAGRIPNELMAEYYRQRASAGLIISEATAVSPMGVVYPNKPKAGNKSPPLITPDQQTFYADGPRGFTDYPALPD